MLRFPKVDVPRLLERLGISYERKGSMVWALCPAPEHPERTASWRMIDDPNDDRHGQHRCYGCGRGGWPVHLVEMVLGCDRRAAAAWLRDTSTAPPLPFAIEVDFTKSMNRRFVIPEGVRFEPYESWPERPHAYVASRGIADWQVDRWRLGYTTRRYHERFNPMPGRIVFVVRNAKGVPISYTGRTYVDSPKRFKEPSKSENADVGAVFGEEFWPKHSQRRIAVVTEGAIDALAIERCFPYSLPIAGLYGSQLTPKHLLRLSTFERIVMATDPDAAGDSVADKLADELARHAKVVRAELPNGFDPAKLWEEDRAELKEIVGRAITAARK